MCRNIRVLLNFEPPATEDEMRAAALQYVRKVSGTNKPSKVNEGQFLQAIEEITSVTRRLLAGMEIHSPPRNRDEEAVKAKERNQKRFGVRPA